MDRRTFLVGAAVALAGCPSDRAVGGGSDSISTEETRQQFAERYNDMRENRGLATAELDAALSEMGQSHAENMAEHNYIGHEQPDGTTIEDRYRERGLLSACELPAEGDRYYPGAENAAGAAVGEVTHPGTDEYFDVTDGDSLAAFLMDSWMSSDGHRRVMVLPAVRLIGLGVAVREDGEIFAALEFC